MKKVYDVDDVMGLLSIKRTAAYEIIKCLNEKLKQEGYMIVPGRISVKYFEEVYALSYQK